MTRDYSHRKGNGNTGNNARRKQNNRRSGGLPTPVSLFLGLTIGLICAAAVYIKVKPVERGLSEAQAPTNPAPKPKSPAAPDGRFTFYDMLPNYEIVVRGDAPAGKPAAKPEKTPEKPIEQPGQYLIQAGSFATADEADRRKASLAMLGVESRIERGDGPDGRPRFRVRIGPMQDLNRVNAILKDLRDNGIEALLMRLKA